MMAELKNQEQWREPLVGRLFGHFLYEIFKDNDQLLNRPEFIMGKPYRESWLRSIRNFVLEGAAARYPKLREDQYLVVKEPNGSIGAPLIVGALPESRMILLIRDPRDVIASRMDASREGSWNYERSKQLYRDERMSSDKDLMAVVQRQAKEYLNVMGKAKEAYDVHKGYKVLIRYEELRADTLGTMKRMYSALRIAVDEGNWPRLWRNTPGRTYLRSRRARGRSGVRPRQAGGGRTSLASKRI
jgi:hypothetical protein